MNWKISVLSLSAWAVGLVSCGGRDDRPKSVEELFEGLEVSCSTERMDFDEREMVEPIYIACLDNSLLIGNFFTDPQVTVYDLDSQKRVGAFLHKGRANNEVLQVDGVDCCGGRVYVYSGSDRKLAIADRAGLRQTPVPLEVRTVSEIPDGHGYGRHPICGGRFVSTGYQSSHPDCQFFLTDSSLCEVKGFDAYPETAVNAGLTPAEMALGYNGNVKVSPDGSHFVATSRQGAVWKFFDCRTDSVPVKTAEYLFEIPVFSSASSGSHSTVRFDPDNVQGVLSATSDDRYFYLLYSDRRPWRDWPRESDVVYVFTHEGKPVRKVLLDVPVGWIVSGADGEALYLLKATDEGYQVRRVVWGNQR